MNIDILGIETEHAGKKFKESENDVASYLYSVGYKKTQKIGHDSFFMKN